MDDVVAALRSAGCVWAEEEAEQLRRAALDQAVRTGEVAASLLRRLVARRVAGEPLEHVVGRVRFAGMTLLVTPGVFVPRRRTEHLAELAVERARPGSVIVELCSGAAPVAAAVLAAEQEAVVHAVDSHPAAVACAERNLRDGHAHRGDLYGGLPRLLRRRVDVVVASPPYVPSDEVSLMPREARIYEERAALDGGSDGLDLHRRILAEAPRWLAPGGQVLLECAARQAGALTDLFREHGFSPEIARDEEREATAVVAPLL
ncbi:putative protein N(5)-glutamine methyltransferase [Nocardioides daejeonensis]|uniref:putative protein N(5)-glutamine methyltransferase n=1 Tax=Nocardioides daejeonensis TaxID=1046556 RepID=UPI0019500FB8|nr:putative protein N(5)-glutamine methyltransferase [Nocardioides daejeonensis]